MLDQLSALQLDVEILLGHAEQLDHHVKSSTQVSSFLLDADAVQQAIKQLQLRLLSLQNQMQDVVTNGRYSKEDIFTTTLSTLNCEPLVIQEFLGDEGKLQVGFYMNYTFFMQSGCKQV